MITSSREGIGLSTINANAKRVNDLVRSQTPVVFSNRPVAPQHYLENPEALECWDRIVNGLERIRVLLESDQAIIEVYVSTYVRKREAERLLIDPRTGRPVLTYKSRSKYNINPLLTIIGQCDRLMIQCLREMGLTPNSRAKVTITADSDADKLSDFLDAAG